MKEAITETLFSVYEKLLGSTQIKCHQKPVEKITL